ncbi:oxygen-independent coproporphyrinogen III oxidase [PVC group bacterium (ex Bugula neritina AB1)]|nr:oxygen-independent coproporphyrinogen III oxidase [PVC group bacterium (ex Bugula neritina AB1)]
MHQVELTKELINKYNIQGPRYTSYPTAPHWSSDVSSESYQEALQKMTSDDSSISLYIHIPYCEQLCTFCACNVKITQRHQSVGDSYVDLLIKELDLIDQNLSKKKVALQCHFGGGTPNFLTIEQMERLWNRLKESFDISLDGEISIEVDPRTVTKEQLRYYREIGFNRISMGIQDFDTDVQKAINRVQSFSLVKDLFETCRALSYVSINFDLIYGLPFQTKETFMNTVDHVCSLSPDRIALYSFAYVPWLKKQQKLIDPKTLPSPEEKIDIFLASRDFLFDHHYKGIAMDHFALETDEMFKAFESQKLYRNFMGYTLKHTQDFIGLGVSSIGFLQNTFVQNHKNLKTYRSNLEENILPTERGKILTKDDKIRFWVIYSFMCHFFIDTIEFKNKFKVDFNEYFKKEEKHIQKCVEEGLLIKDKDTFLTTDLGKLFIRNICMGFDAYFSPSSEQKFSQTV